MKHNELTKKAMEFLEDLEIGASLLEIKKDADEWRKRIYKSIKVCKLPNWNLI